MTDFHVTLCCTLPITMYVYVNATLDFHDSDLSHKATINYDYLRCLLIDSPNPCQLLLPRALCVTPASLAGRRATFFWRFRTTGNHLIDNAI